VWRARNRISSAPALPHNDSLPKAPSLDYTTVRTAHDSAMPPIPNSYMSAA